jgi:hypothetical protein
MTELRTVTALSSGSYSTYQLHCVFEDPADADRAEAELNAGKRFGDYFTERLVVMPAGRLPKKKTTWTVHVCAGNVDGPHELMAIPTEIWEWEPAPELAELHPGQLQHPTLSRYHGTDKDRVMAAAQAKLAELKSKAAEPC